MVLNTVSKADLPSICDNVPLLAVHAADDPIIHADTLHMTTSSAGDDTVCIEDFDNLISLVTATGGHVGLIVTENCALSEMDIISSCCQ